MRDEEISIENTLKDYENNGFPQLPPGFMGSHFLKSDEDIDKLLQLENSWQEVICIKLDKATRMFQESIWEIFTSERSYILVLKLAVDVYIAILLDLQQNGILNNVDLSELFGNIKELYKIHLNFWQYSMVPILNRFRKTKDLLTEEIVEEIYQDIESRLQKPYLRYLQTASQSIDYGRELQQSSSIVRQYCDWCERQQPLQTSNSANIPNLSLDSIQSNPHQRITRYGILLNSIVQRSPSPSSSNLTLTFERVDALCRWLNNRVKLGELEKRIKSASFNHFKINSQLVEHELSRFQSIKSSFDFKGKMFNCSSTVKRNLLAEISGVHMKNSDNRLIPVTLCVLTDVLLICHLEDERENRIMNDMTLIRAPLRTDFIKPLKTEITNKIYLLSVSNYGCPDNCIQFNFQLEKQKNKFLDKLHEARKTYKEVQRGQPLIDDYIKKLDGMFLQNKDDSDPESPDECVIGDTQLVDNNFIDGLNDILTIDPELSLLGLQNIPDNSPNIFDNKKTKFFQKFLKRK